MKTIHSILFTLLFTGTLSAQLVDSIGCTGALGDIKYSILAEVAFIGENGDCWVMLDGREISGSELARSLNMHALPDSRGHFIRCLDNRDNNQNVDLDRRIKNDLFAGSTQQDEIKQHGHNIPDMSISGQNVTSSPTGSVSQVVGYNNSYSTLKTEDTGGPETRPENITMYTYIRIN